MRQIERTIVSAILISKDNKILMGRKDPDKGGVYPDCWHIPGGGVDGGESFEHALQREVKEEIGFDISPYKPVLIPIKHVGVSEKILGSGERVICNMDFNTYRIEISDKDANEIELYLSDDLVEAKWFGMDELPSVKQIPGGKEFFQEIGLISKN